MVPADFTLKSNPIFLLIFLERGRNRCHPKDGN